MPDICYGQYQVCHFCGSPKCVRPCSCRLQSSTLARLIWSKLGKAGTQDEGAFLDGSVIWWAMIATRSQTLISPLRSPTAWHSNWSSTPRCTTHSCSDMALPCLLVRESESLVSLKKSSQSTASSNFFFILFHLFTYLCICIGRMADWSKCRFAEANKRLRTFRAGIGMALNGWTSLWVRKLSALTLPIRGAATFDTLASESSSKSLSPPPSWQWSQPGALKVYCSLRPLVSHAWSVFGFQLFWSEMVI